MDYFFRIALFSFFLSLMWFFIFLVFMPPYEATHRLANIKLKIQEFTEEKDLIFETEYWRVILKNDQTYLGSSVLRLKRAVGSCSLLNQEEWSDLHYVMANLEYASKKAFSATMVNWACLMNHAYRNKPYLPLVHFHFHPRYEKPVSFDGLTFTDEEFGSSVAYGTHRNIPDETRKKIIEAIRDNLPKLMRE